MNKKTILCVCVLLVFAMVIGAWGYGVYRTNTDSEQVQIKYHKTGDVVKIEDNFFVNMDEKNYGYEFTVKGGTVKTTEEFLKEHGKDMEYLTDGSSNRFVPDYVYDVEVNVRNVNNTSQAGFSLIGLVLCAANNQIQVNSELFNLLYPQLNGVYGFSVKPETDMTFHLPYTAIKKYNDICDYEYYTKKDLYLVVSWYPVENRILVDTLN